ncbi:unnamed protein product [Prorocentrum cordatum]|uniref:RCK N-terminal domain-containing protein n=1 Tax=Prorocentrum cordatum TaxID=2364126 RepID=A0ABN9TXM3_9DINO|nr:unnamed protein product [Polarella glacialis]
MAAAASGPPSWARLIPRLSLGESHDMIVLLLATTVVVPLMKRMKTSPIIGFLLIGLLLGPSGIHQIQNVELAEVIAEFGIIFFLFEMGLELSIKKVLNMKADVFGIGTATYLLTFGSVALLAKGIMPSASAGTLVVLGGALALSSSAFALQLLRDNGQLGTRYGRSTFGALLFQDLAVVPLLVVVPLLAPGAGGASLAVALLQACGKAVAALGVIVVGGHVLLRRAFAWAKRSRSQEAFLAVTLGVVLLCSAITESLGLSNTLGAFVGGVLVAETDYKYQVEADIAPFRGLLLGLFFVTVGFSLDCRLLIASWAQVVPLLLGLLALKGAITGLVCRGLGGLSRASALQVAALLAPGGEFAFVAFGLAERLQLLQPRVASLLVTTTVLSMGLTPVLAGLADSTAERMRRNRDPEYFKGTDKFQKDVQKISAANQKGFVVLCGWNAVSRAVCELLDSEGSYQYIVFESEPSIASRARATGLPVFLADCRRREVLENFNVEKAALVVIVAPRREADAYAAAFRRFYPGLPIVCRAEDEKHKRYLQDILKVSAVIPRLISVRFGGFVLRSLGRPQAEIESLIEEQRRRAMRDLSEQASEQGMLDGSEGVDMLDQAVGGALPDPGGALKIPGLPEAAEDDAELGGAGPRPDAGGSADAGAGGADGSG